MTVSIFVSHILIPLGVLSFYFVISSLLLPEGVNKVFVTRSAKYTIPITITLYVAFILFIGIRRIKDTFLSTSVEELSSYDLILPLFPLTPVVQYIINNTDIISLLESVIIFCFFIMLVSLPILVVPLLLRNTGSTRLVMFLGLAFTFLIMTMASLTKQFAWHEVGSLKIQLPVLVGVWFISWLIFKLNLRGLIYLFIVAYFITNSIFQLNSHNRSVSSAELDQTDNLLVTLIDSQEPVITPSIYLLVYDSYVVNETMLAYGIDNGVQEHYLEDLGFKIYPHTYSTGASSLGSISRVLNVSVEYYGPQRKGVSGDGIIQNLLEEFGYKTYGIFQSDYFFRGMIPSYDYSFPGSGSSSSTLIEAILEGEFRFDINMDKVSQEQYLQEKYGAFLELPESPKFIYTHSNLPGHSQNSGVCRPNEVELFGDRLAKANLEMRNDVEMIIKNDPKAIVIVAGDHGPYLTKNCTSTEQGDAFDISEISRLDIQDRYGAFLAIKWPSVGFEEYDDITILQDLFPTVFAYIFADPGLLESQLEPNSTYNTASGAMIVDGVIVGGIHNSETLFIGGIER